MDSPATGVQAPDRSAAFRAALAALVPVQRNVYELAGRTWRLASEDSPVLIRLCLEEADAGVEIRVEPGYRSTFRWSWHRSIAPLLSLWVGEEMETLSSAVQAALAFQPAVQHFEYLGQVHVWYEAGTMGGRPLPNRWSSAIEGEAASIYLSEASEAREEDRWMWERRCAAAAPVVALVSGAYGGNLGASCATMQEAMRACVDAPEMFKRACGALIARLCGPPEIGVPDPGTPAPVEPKTLEERPAAAPGVLAPRGPKSGRNGRRAGFRVGRGDSHG